MSNKLVKTVNQVSLVDANLSQLAELVTQAVEHHVEVAPLYKTIVDRILGILSKEEELSVMKQSDIIKLLEVAAKAQIAPVEQLTKLVQAVTDLHEQSKLQDKIRDLESVIVGIKSEAERANVLNSAEEAEFTTLDAILEVDEDTFNKEF